MSFIDLTFDNHIVYPEIDPTNRYITDAPSRW